MGRIITPPGLSVPKSVTQANAQAPVPEEVREWGQLVGWLRMKDYSPLQVRQMLEAVEAKEYEKLEGIRAKCDGSE